MPDLTTNSKRSSESDGRLFLFLMAMKAGKRKKLIRKFHRYLSIFIGIQFFFWALSGLYFSWTDIDEIHGDQFRRPDPGLVAFDRLLDPNDLGVTGGIRSLELRNIAGKPFYWINETSLYDARNGTLKKEITKEEALAIAKSKLLPSLKVAAVKKIEKTGPQHEYRGKPLPAYLISYEGPARLHAYVSARDGAFQTVRHRSWRWFDFLWMLHTMDYRGRDDFNTLWLRIAAFLAFTMVLSGFVLWVSSSARIRQVKRWLKSGSQ